MSSKQNMMLISLVSRHEHAKSIIFLFLHQVWCLTDRRSSWRGACIA